MQNGDEALPSIILAGRGILVKMLIILDLHNIFWSKLHTYMYTFNGMQNDDKAMLRQVVVRCS